MEKKLASKDVDEVVERDITSPLDEVGNRFNEGLSVESEVALGQFLLFRRLAVVTLATNDDGAVCGIKCLTEVSQN